MSASRTLLEPWAEREYPDTAAGVENLLYCRCSRLEQMLEKMERKIIYIQQERDSTVKKLSARLVAALDAERQLEFAFHRIKRLESCEETEYLRKRVTELNLLFIELQQRT